MSDNQRTLMRLDYLELDPFVGIRLPDDELTALKWKLLGKLDIRQEQHPGSTPLVAWRDAMADRNNLERSELDPAQGGSLDLMLSSQGVRSWVFFLA